MDYPYGLLFKEKDMLLHRGYFSELVKLIGVQVIHRAPRPSKTYTTYAEVESNYFEPQAVGCIFDEHPTQRTMKKLGWNAELDASASIISVPYDLNGIQQGSLFVIPSAVNPSIGRLFRVVEISSIMIYPSSLTCRIVPEFENTFTNNSYVHKNNSFNLLNREED